MLISYKKRRINSKSIEVGNRKEFIGLNAIGAIDVGTGPNFLHDVWTRPVKAG